ncbi:MAG: hypothetical protein ABR507_02460 [Actinomycetota bacterium]
MKWARPLRAPMYTVILIALWSGFIAMTNNAARGWGAGAPNASPTPSPATVSSRIGSPDCNHTADIEASPGQVVTVEACFVRNGVPSQAEPVVFSQSGPSPDALVQAVTDNNGRGSTSLSSPRPGVSHIGACDRSGCIAPIQVRWGSGGSTIDEPVLAPSLRVEAIGSNIGSLRPVASGLEVPQTSSGFDCRKGPETPSLDLPAFASIKSVIDSKRSHPKTGSMTQSIEVTTGQDFLVGSVLYGRPTLLFLAMHRPGHVVDEEAVFPFQGHDRLDIFWTTGNIRFGKQQLEYDGTDWVEVPATFTFALGGGGVQTFFADDVAFGASGIGVGTEIQGRCSAQGVDRVRQRSTPVRSEKKTTDATKAVGIAVLVAMGMLALGITRSTRPPAGGLFLEAPKGESIRLERSDIHYDDIGRPTGFVEIVELPDGTTRTVRTRIVQEDLVVDVPPVLDVADWEDDVIVVERSSFSTDTTDHLASYLETSSAPDGTSESSSISNIVYDHYQRVLRFDRSTNHPLSSIQRTRSERYILEFEDPPDGRSVSPRLAMQETVERRGFIFDDEGHVNRYVSVIWTAGDGRLIGDTFEPDSPRVLFEMGRAAERGMALISSPNRGAQRARHILTRWFRRHGCLVRLRLVDPASKPLEGLIVTIGGQRTKTDTRGRLLLWVLSPGNYVLGLDRGADPAKQIAWIVVQHVPGNMNQVVVVETSEQQLVTADG